MDDSAFARFFPSSSSSSFSSSSTVGAATAAAQVAVALAVEAVAVPVAAAVAVVVEAKPAALRRRYRISAEMNPPPRSGSGLRERRRRGDGRAQNIVTISANNPAVLARNSQSACLVPPSLLRRLRSPLLLLMEVCGPGVAVPERSLGGGRGRRG